MNTALRSAVLGAATGARSMTGLAGIALTTAPGTQTGWTARLGNRWGRRLATTAALGEILADKNPRMPSRLSPPALAERITVGAISAAALARREGVRPVVPVLFGIAGVIAASIAGARWRAYAQKRRMAIPAALIEDMVAIGLAAAACTATARPRR